MFRVLAQERKKRRNEILSRAGGSASLGKGQVILEFALCMIVILLMIFGITKVMIWTGRDFAERSRAHDQVLFSPIDQSYLDISDGPLKQIDPYFYNPVKMNAIWKKDL